MEGQMTKPHGAPTELAGQGPLGRFGGWVQNRQLLNGTQRLRNTPTCSGFTAGGGRGVHLPLLGDTSSTTELGSDREAMGKRKNSGGAWWLVGHDISLDGGSGLVSYFVLVGRAKRLIKTTRRQNFD